MRRNIDVERLQVRINSINKTIEGYLEIQYTQRREENKMILREEVEKSMKDLVSVKTEKKTKQFKSYSNRYGRNCDRRSSVLYMPRNR